MKCNVELARYLKNQVGMLGMFHLNIRLLEAQGWNKDDIYDTVEYMKTCGYVIYYVESVMKIGREGSTDRRKAETKIYRILTTQNTTWSDVYENRHQFVIV